MAKTPKAKPTYDNDVEGAKSHTKREERAARALKQGLLFPPDIDSILEKGIKFSDDKRSELSDIVMTAKSDLSKKKVKFLVSLTEALVSMLIDTRENRHEFVAELELLTKLESAAVVLWNSWVDVSSNSLLFSAMNEIVRRDLAVNLANKLATHNTLYDIGPIIAITTALDEIVETFTQLSIDFRTTIIEASRITRPYEYLFVTFLGLCWASILRKLPTVTRNKEAHATPPKTPFQRYLEAAVPGTPISEEVIRASIDQLRSWGARTTKKDR